MTAAEQRDAVARVRSAVGELAIEDQLATLQIAWHLTASIAREPARRFPEALEAATVAQLEVLEDMAEDVVRDFPDLAYVRLYETGNLEVVWQERADRAADQPVERDAAQQGEISEAVNSRIAMLIANLSALITAPTFRMPAVHKDDGEPIFLIARSEIQEASKTVEELDKLCRRQIDERDTKGGD